jgi:hypothetical protein
MLNLKNISTVMDKSKGVMQKNAIKGTLTFFSPLYSLRNFTFKGTFSQSIVIGLQGL